MYLAEKNLTNFPMTFSMNAQVYIHKAPPQIPVWASKISLHGRHMFSFITKSPYCNPALISRYYIMIWGQGDAGSLVHLGMMSLSKLARWHEIEFWLDVYPFTLPGKKQLDVLQSCEHVSFSWHCVTMRHFARCSNPAPESKLSLLPSLA